MLRYLAPSEGFLGTDTGPAESARAVVIPFGLESSVSYGGGTGAGPMAILAASREVELFETRWWCEPAMRYGVATLEADPVPRVIPAALDLLAGRVEWVLEQGRLPLVLGGEHSLTVGALRPFLARYPGLVMLHFDAHADLRDGYLGEHFSHASAIRRCFDDPDLEVVSVGLRNISAEGAAFLEANGHRHHVHWARDRRSYDPVSVCAPLRGRPVYISFDLDAFDASLMPATGTPEPGGLFWDDVMPILMEAGRVGHVVGADVVELAPLAGFHAPDFLAAKLGYRILSAALMG